MKRLSCLVAILLLAGCDLGDSPPLSLGTLEVDRISIAADSNEPIVEVLVREGDAVVPGDVLMRQDPARVQARLKQAQADLAVARAQLAEAEAGPRAQDIAGARAKVAAADSEMRTAHIELERERSLVTQNYSSKNNVDILEGRYDSALARKDEAEALLAELLEGTRSESIDAARSKFAMAEARVEDIEITLARTDVRAPIAGKVEAVIHELGERPQVGSTIVVLVEDQKPYARVHVPEPLRTRLANGAKAEILIDGHAPLMGRLRWIAHDASYTPYFALTQHDRGHLSYLAEVEVVGDGASDVATGIPVQVRFPDIE